MLVAGVISATVAPAAGQQIPGTGYLEEGTPGVYAGYVERPEAVVSPDRTRRSAAPRRICGWFAWDLGDVFVKADPSTMVPGELYLLSCHDAETGAAAGADFRVWDPDRPGGGVITTRRDLETFVVSLFDLRTPPTQMAPPPGSLVVGLDTWLGHPADGTVQVRHAQAGPLWATGQAEVVSVTYSPGDGRPPVHCSPVPGPPHPDGPPPDCARITWLTHGTYELDVSADHRIDVTTGDNTTGQVDGPELADVVTTGPDTVPVTVRELEAVIR